MVSKPNKILFIAANGPNESFGGGQRNILLINLLLDKGFEVDIVLVINKAWGVYDDDTWIVKKWRNDFNIIKIFQPSFTNLYKPDFEISKFIRTVQVDYKFLVFRYEIIAFKSAFYLLNRKKVIIDFDDFLFPHIKGWRKIKYWPLHQLQRYFISQAWIVNDNDKKYFGNNYFWLPNLPLALFSRKNSNVIFTKEKTKYPSLLFVGSNIDDVILLLKNKSFKNLENIENFKFFIISKSITNDHKLNFANSSVEWLNNVDDIEEYYKKTWISIAPGYKKQGTNIKVIESIFYETPIIVTKSTIRGYEEFNENENLLPVVETDEHLITLIFNLFTDYSSLKITESNLLKMKAIQENKFSYAQILKKINFKKI